MQGSIRQVRQHAVRPHHIRGQALVLGLVLLLVLCVGAILLFNTGQIVHKKVQLTNTADAAAYSVAVQQARAWNFAAYMNRARIANEVAIAQTISIYSWLNQLNTSSENLATLFLSLSAIVAIAPVTMPLYRIFSAADRVLGQIRNVYRQFAAGLVQFLDLMNEVYAASAAVVINYVAGAEAMIVATQVVEKNLPKARVSAPSLAYLLIQLAKGKNEFLAYHELPRRGQSEAFNRYRNVVMQSRDGFSWNRTDRIGIGPVHFSVYGGTDMVEYDRWAALDTMQLEVDLPWPDDDIDVPVGWGGAQAVTSYKGQKFLPGFNNGKGWRSPFDKKRYGIYGGMDGSDWVTKQAARDPNVDGNKQGAYFTDYEGLRAYHDVKPGNVMGSENGPTYTVEVQTDTAAARTSTEVGIGAGRMELREKADTMAAVASAQVYFNRPAGVALFQRGDDKLEHGSLFSPYWQARLVETPGDALLALGVAGAWGP